jgi:hypothetical protein
MAPRAEPELPVTIVRHRRVSRHREGSLPEASLLWHQRRRQPCTKTNGRHPATARADSAATAMAAAAMAPAVMLTPARGQSLRSAR